MELTERQWQLFDFVKEMHGKQKRKYSGEPYYTHLLSVASKVSLYSTMGCEIEIALCHDLIEDTPCSLAVLSSLLISVGYNLQQDAEILSAVDDLTDKYTTEKYPLLNRAQRKELEATRLVSSKPVAQTVKYADIIDNISSIVTHDQAFAKVYLAEINKYIWQINKGNPELYKECCTVFQQARQDLANSR
jgi:(p)ppGpp synthase/HD superfamily hydrolase